MIVGRDTGHLSSEQVAKAAVETVAENASDGTAAPLFMALGGAPLGFFYKGINTLDSMVGYKNDRYMFFGRFSAKLDNAANFIPARLCALLIDSCQRISWNGYEKRLAHIQKRQIQSRQPEQRADRGRVRRSPRYTACREMLTISAGFIRRKP